MAQETDNNKSGESGTPVGTASENPSFSSDNRSLHTRRDDVFCEKNPPLTQSRDTTILSESEHERIRTFVNSEPTRSYRPGDNFADKENPIDFVYKELCKQSPEVRNFIWHVVNIPGVTVDILRRATSPNRQHDREEEGREESTSKESHATTTFVGDHHAGECTGSGIHVVTGLRRASTGSYDVRLKDQPNNATQRDASMGSSRTATMVDYPMPPDFTSFNKNCGEQPSYNLERANMTDECDETSQLSLQTKPTEVTSAPSHPSNPVTEETQSASGYPVFTSKPVRYSHMENPTVAAAASSIPRSQGLEVNWTATPVPATSVLSAESPSSVPLTSACTCKKRSIDVTAEHQPKEQDLITTVVNNSMPPISQSCEGELLHSLERKEMDKRKPSPHQKPTEKTSPPNSPSSGSVLEQVQGLTVDITSVSPPSLPSVIATPPPPTATATATATPPPPNAIPPPPATTPSAPPSPTTCTTPNSTPTPSPGTSEGTSEGRKKQRKWFFWWKRGTESKDLLLPYPINMKGKHGLALIIVNEIFSHLADRDCANEDLRVLRELCEFLGYRVRVERNLTSEQIQTLFKDIREQIQPYDDSFLCFISSHGTWDPVRKADVVCGVDGVQIKVGGEVVAVEGAVDIKDLVLKYLSDQLEGRPKVFFIQACRGRNPGRITSNDECKKHVPSETTGIGTGPRPTPPTHLPQETNFLFAYSTTLGYRSYRRDPTTSDPGGSFFITYLCQFLKDYAKQLPLTLILDAVSQKLAALEPPFELSNGMETRQFPNYSSSLHGPVFFFNESYERHKKSLNL